jgi:hypothetical protein
MRMFIHVQQIACHYSTCSCNIGGLAIKQGMDIKDKHDVVRLDPVECFGGELWYQLHLESINNTRMRAMA